MKRKIVKHGSATLTVSLPAKWARKYQIKQGDEVDVEEKDSNIIVSTQTKTKETSKKIIDISGLTSSLVWRKMFAAYTNGFEEIEVRFDNPLIPYSGTREEHKQGELIDVHKILDKIANNLIGFEIVNQTQNKCIFKELSKPKEKEFESALKRIFFLLKENTKELEFMLKNKDMPLFETIRLRETTINKFANLCIRLLKIQKKSLFPLYHLLFLLEQLGDELFKISRYLKIHGLNPAKPIQAVLKKLSEIYDTLYDLFFKNISPKDFYLHYIMNFEKILKNTKISTSLSVYFDNIISIMKDLVLYKMEIELEEKELQSSF